MISEKVIGTWERFSLFLVLLLICDACGFDTDWSVVQNRFQIQCLVHGSTIGVLQGRSFFQNAEQFEIFTFFFFFFFNFTIYSTSSIPGCIHLLLAQNFR
ncbi:hypothetical protein RND81_12G203300 [Saponaria officinalis]|uniref:Secreted protein n=1 Tax=Saponaria officinalis TaxID=3572 RepID=A0AAW1HD21_SAPOF